MTEEKIKYTKVKFLKESPPFMGEDLEFYGDEEDGFEEGDIAKVPEYNAEILEEKGYAEEILQLGDVETVEDLEQFMENLAKELIQDSETPQEAGDRTSECRFGQAKDNKRPYDILREYDGEEVRQAEKQAIEQRIDDRIAEVNAIVLENLLKREIQAQLEQEESPMEVKNK